MKLWFTSVLLVLSGCALYPQSLEDMLDRPAEFDGKTILLSGVIHFSYEGDSLCSGENIIFLKYNRSVKDKLRVYRANDLINTVRLRGRFETVKDFKGCPEDMVCIPHHPKQFLRVHKIQPFNAPQSISIDDPDNSCAGDRPVARSPIDGAEIYWKIKSYSSSPKNKTVHLGISESDGSYWRYEYASGRGVEAAHEADRASLDR